MLALPVLSAPLWTFRYSSVCGQCGAIQNTTEWQLPFCPVAYWKHSSIGSTPLSDALSAAGAMPPHQHTWRFAAGGGNGVTCAIGSARHLLRTCQSPELAAYISAIAQFESPEKVDLIRAVALDPSTSSAVVGTVALADPRVFTMRESYERWKRDHREELHGLGCSGDLQGRNLSDE
jgi:hypothetical protein